jgi:PAS domain S-box-containing protein
MSNKVLFVDDEQNILDAYWINFRKRFDVALALGPEEGLKIVQTDGPFSVVVSDLKMPEMDGATFLSKIRDLAPDTTRIILTGYADINAAMDSVNKGHVFRFLTKPCLPHILAQAVQDGINQNTLLLTATDLHRESTEHRARLENILKGTDAGTWEWSIPTGEVSVNERWAGIVGYKLDELLPVNIDTWLGLVHPDDLAQSEQLLNDHFENKSEFYSVELRMKHKSGEWIWVRDHGQVATRDDHGRPLIMYGTHINITDRKNIESRLESALQRAEYANKAKSEFLAIMSHEIRTPLNGIMGMIDLLLGTAMNDAQHRYSKIIQSSGEILLDLINDILDFSKIEAGRPELNSLEFNLVQLVEDFCESMAVHSIAKGLELLCAIDPDVPETLQGDPGRLRQILTNLVSNSIKFTQKGEVLVRVSLVSDVDNICIVKFSVLDTGIGIHKDNLNMIFNKFTQIDSSPSRSYGGTGLGLAISKQLTELMGGKIGVLANEGRGAEFWFTASFLKSHSSSQRTHVKPETLNGIRVLIVDSHTTNCEIMASRMKMWGMFPLVVCDCESALKALISEENGGNPFRIAIIDSNSFGVNGEALGLKIKASSQLSETRMIILTSLGRKGDARRFEEIGFDAYLSKPIRYQELYDMMCYVTYDSPDFPRETIITRHYIRERLPLFTPEHRILIVEDNVANQFVALEILKVLGLQSDVANNGNEALMLLASAPYCAVLMDVHMPGLDGFETTRAIRDPLSKALNKDVPIIAMTANVMIGDREKCLKSGMDDYISKPLSQAALTITLAKWVPHTVSGIYRQPPELSQAGHIFSLLKDSNELFDQEGVLARFGNNAELTRMALNVTLNDMPTLITSLKSCLAGDDAIGVELHAHTIKSAAATIGGLVLYRLATTIEEAACNGDLDVVKSNVGEIDSQFFALKNKIGIFIRTTCCI